MKPSRASGFFSFIFNDFSIQKVIFPITAQPVFPGPVTDVSFRSKLMPQRVEFLWIFFA